MTRWIVSWIFAAGLGMLAVPGVAAADAVKLSGFWIQDVTIRSIADGVLVYTTSSGGEVDKPVGEIEGVRLRLYPELERAVKAGEAGDHAAAADLLGQVRRKAQRRWVERYATKLLVGEAAASGRPLDAVRAYVELVRGGADTFFVPAAPTAAVAAAPGDVKRDVAELVRPLIGRTADAYRGGLEGLLAAAQPGAAPPGSPGSPGSPVSPTVPPAAAPLPAPPAAVTAESAVTLPNDITSGDLASSAIVEALRRGAFREALEAAEAAVQTSGHLSDHLYLLGMAQLGLAEQTGDAGLYMDAGLSFMRVVVYFPRSGVVGPALLEAGYVHEKIGREDQARKLYDRARLLIDPEHDPAYHQRLVKLAG